MSVDLRDELVKSTLCRQMESHGARLYNLASVLAVGVPLVPSAAALRYLGGHLRELSVHVVELSELYRGVVGETLAPTNFVRAEDRAPPSAARWSESIAAQLVANRQARWQLHEHDQCAWAPYREFVARAVAALDGRQNLAEQLAQSAATDDREGFGTAFDAWTAWAVTAFGQPGTPGMAYAIRVGLRRRDASATRADFLDDLRGIARLRSLPLAPRWQPEPERASIITALEALAARGADNA